MLFITVGIVILVASFVLALISLVREQRSLSAKTGEPSVQPEIPETKIEEPMSTANQAPESAGRPQTVLQESEETVNVSKSDVISRLEEQIEKAKTTEKVSPKPGEGRQNTDEFWNTSPRSEDGFSAQNKMMSDKDEDANAPSEPFPWEQAEDLGSVQTQAGRVQSKTDDLSKGESAKQSTGGVIHMSDLVKKP